jgi:hypothetical protein
MLPFSFMDAVLYQLALQRIIVTKQTMGTRKPGQVQTVKIQSPAKSLKRRVNTKL